MSVILRSIILVCMLVPLCGAGTPAFAMGKDRNAASPFKYVGGTEKLPENCHGALEVGTDSLSFVCPGGSVSVPYAAISLMQYRPDVQPGRSPK